VHAHMQAGWHGMAWHGTRHTAWHSTAWHAFSVVHMYVDAGTHIHDVVTPT